MDFFDLLLNLFITLAGVFLGAYLALWLDRREKTKTEKLEIKETAKSLESELKENSNRLNTGNKISIYKINEVERKTLLTHFNTAILESIINSGKTILLPKEIQLDISNLHQILYLCEMTTSRLFDVLTSTTDRRSDKEGIKPVVWLVDNLEAQYDILSTEIPRVIKELQKLQ